MDSCRKDPRLRPHFRHGSWCNREHPADTDSVEMCESAARHGAHLYRALAGGSTEPALVDLAGDGETANGDVWVSSTWSLAIHSPNTAPTAPSTDTAQGTGGQVGLEAFGDDPPPG
jgi:hypothetical protein